MCFKIWHHPSWDLQSLVPVCCLLGFAALLKIKQVFIWFLQTFSSQRRYRKMVWNGRKGYHCSDASSVSSFCCAFLSSVTALSELTEIFVGTKRDKGKGYNCCLTPNTVVLSFLSTASSFEVKSAYQGNSDPP